MSMIRVSVKVRDLEGLDANYEEIVQAIESNLDEVAAHVETEAKTSLLFHDHKGILRPSIKKFKSKFENGGFIIVAKSPHAHLVEYGHVMLNKFGEPTKLDRVPAHPFMRKAGESGIRKAIALIRVEK